VAGQAQFALEKAAPQEVGPASLPAVLVGQVGLVTGDAGERAVRTEVEVVGDPHAWLDARPVVDLVLLESSWHSRHSSEMSLRKTRLRTTSL